MRRSCLVLVLAAACGGSGDDGGGGDAAIDAPGTSGDGGSGGARCAPVPPASGATMTVASASALAAAIESATPGLTIEVAAGTYDVRGVRLWIDTPGVTLRGATGDRGDVRLEAGHVPFLGGVINVAADDVTIAHLTIVEGRFHAIHVFGTDSPTERTRIHDVHVIDPGEQAIKINSNPMDADGGEVSCSHLELTRGGAGFVTQQVSSGSRCYTGGIDAHRARGWTVRDNHIEGFWCAGSGGEYLSEHGIHFWRGSRDTLVERNLLVNNARAIGLGLDSQGRTYADTPCPGVTMAGHYGGVIRANAIVGNDATLFASGNGMDTGIALWSACGATVIHNSIGTTGAPFTGIEWRFAETSVTVVNNLVTARILARDGNPTSIEAGNLASAAPSLFADVGGGDLHLAPGASAAIDQGATGYEAVTGLDLDGETRTSAPDVGADER